MPARNARESLGRSGERHARVKLEAVGYRFIESNWRCESGEIDLVMLDGDDLVFVEVKARRGERAGRADDAVSWDKAERLLATGEWYVAEHPEHQHRLWRVDIVAIAVHPNHGTATVRHYINAVVGD